MIQISAKINDNFEMRNKAVHKDRVNRVLKGLNACFLNIIGLFKHLDELRLFSDDHSPHLLCLNETKLDSDVADNELRLEGFHEIFRKDRDKKWGRCCYLCEKQYKMQNTRGFWRRLRIYFC